MTALLLNAHLPEMELHPLAASDARELLRIRHKDLAASVSSRLLDEARGNPLAILELPTALESGARRGSVPLPDHLPVTARLESAFASKAEGLPSTTRTLLLVAALEDQGRLAEILRAAEIVAGAPVTVLDLDPALSAGLVHFDGQTLRFRHPLVRSALHHAAHVAELHAAHTALADVLASEPDRSIWHRAAAVVGFDPQVATGLEQAGRRADMRGAVETAAIAFERAAAVAGDPERRGSLLLSAATKAAELGRTATMQRLVVEAESLPLGQREMARAVWIKELLDTGPAGDPARVERLVTTAGRAAEAGEVDLALHLLAAAAFHLLLGRPRPARGLRCPARDRGSGPGSRRSPAASDRGICSAARAWRRRQRPAARRWSCRAAARILYLLGTAASHAGRFDEAVELLGQSAARLREGGRLGVSRRSSRRRRGRRSSPRTTPSPCWRPRRPTGWQTRRANRCGRRGPGSPRPCSPDSAAKPTSSPSSPQAPNVWHCPPRWRACSRSSSTPAAFRRLDLGRAEEAYEHLESPGRAR